MDSVKINSASTSLGSKNNKRTTLSPEKTQSFGAIVPPKVSAKVVEAADKLFKNDKFIKSMSYVQENELVSNSLYALFLAGVARPLTLLATASEKSKTDNIYASSHSISSGLIGLASTVVVATPLGKALNAISKNPEKYLKKNMNLVKPDVSKMNKVEALDAIKKSDNFKRVVKMFPDWAIAVPRAAITVALIAPILKHVFGIEKSDKKHDNEAQKQPLKGHVDYNALTAKIANSDAKKQNLGSAPTVVKIAAEQAAKPNGAVTEFLAHKVLAPIINTDFANKLGEKVSKNSRIVDHMSAVGGIITSGTYVGRTLIDKKLDADRRITLAFNQGLVCAVSTVGAYTLSKSLNNATDKLVNHFQKVNGFKDLEHDLVNFVQSKTKSDRYQKLTKELLEANKADKQIMDKFTKYSNLEKAGKGIKALKGLVAFATIYRYISPVLVTPFANKLGEMYLNSRKSEDD